MKVPVVLKVLAHLAAIFGLFLAFTFAMFLGLQVSTLYGNLGLLTVGILTLAYIYFGFVRKRLPKRTARGQASRK